MRGVSDIKKVNGVIDAELDGPRATITVNYDPSRTNIKAIAEATKASLNSDHAATMRGSMAEIEYVTGR